MHGSHRCIVVAAVGWLILAAAPAPDNSTQSEQAQRNNASSAELARIATAIEKFPKASAPDRGCPDGEPDYGSDLCAQWKAATAATDSASWTWWTMLAGFVGLAIGLGTLIAAWCAAHWAKKAAQHTEEGATAAKDALTQAQSGERAWVCFDRIKYDACTGTRLPDGSTADGMMMTIIWKNAGNTPAIEAVPVTLGKVLPLDSECPPFEADAFQGISRVNIGPNMPITPVPFYVLGEDHAGVLRREACVFLFSRVIYKDIFEPSKSRESNICFRIESDGHQIQNGGTVPRYFASPVGSENINT